MGDLMMPIYPVESIEDIPGRLRFLGGFTKGLRSLVCLVHPGKALRGGTTTPIRATPEIES